MFFRQSAFISRLACRVGLPVCRGTPGSGGQPAGDDEEGLGVCHSDLLEFFHIDQHHRAHRTGHSESPVLQLAPLGDMSLAVRYSGLAGNLDVDRTWDALHRGGTRR